MSKGCVPERGARAMCFEKLIVPCRAGRHTRVSPAFGILTGTASRQASAEVVRAVFERAGAYDRRARRKTRPTGVCLQGSQRDVGRHSVGSDLRPKKDQARQRQERLCARDCCMKRASNFVATRYFSHFQGRETRNLARGWIFRSGFYAARASRGRSITCQSHSPATLHVSSV